MIDALILSDGRAIEISICDRTDEVSVSGDTSRLSATSAGMLAHGLDRAAVIAGQRAAKRRLRDLREVSRLTIEQVAAAVESGVSGAPPEPAGSSHHAPSCGCRRNWQFCDCGAAP